MFHKTEISMSIVYLICDFILHLSFQNLNLKNISKGPFYQHGLTLIPAWISDYIHYKVWVEITYPFPNCGLWMDNKFHPTLYWARDNLSILGLKLINVS